MVNRHEVFRGQPTGGRLLPSDGQDKARRAALRAEPLSSTRKQFTKRVFETTGKSARLLELSLKRYRLPAPARALPHGDHVGFAQVDAGSHELLLVVITPQADDARALGELALIRTARSLGPLGRAIEMDFPLDVTLAHRHR